MKTTKRQAKKALGIKTDAELARALECTRAAVCKWRTGPLPKLRQIQLRAWFPERFRVERK
jgi:hypothetical protein